MKRLPAPGTPYIDRLQVLVQSRSITASKCISNLTWSWPPSSHNHGLQVHISKLAQSQPPVHLQARSCTVSNCISKLAWLRPPSASPNSLDQGVQVHLQTCSITSCTCISKLTQLRPPSAYLQTRSVTPSNCISKYARLLPPSASSNLLDHGLGVYLWVHLVIMFRRTSNFSHAPPAAIVDIRCVDG